MPPSKPTPVAFQAMRQGSVVDVDPVSASRRTSTSTCRPSTKIRKPAAIAEPSYAIAKCRHCFPENFSRATISIVSRPQWWTKLILGCDLYQMISNPRDSAEPSICETTQPLGALPGRIQSDNENGL